MVVVVVVVVGSVVVVVVEYSVDISSESVVTSVELASTKFVRIFSF